MAAADERKDESSNEGERGRDNNSTQFSAANFSRRVGELFSRPWDFADADGSDLVKVSLPLFCKKRLCPLIVDTKERSMPGFE